MRILICLLCLLFSCSAMAQSSVYSVGNSLTNDTLPMLLDDSNWHVYCSKNLNYIYENPFGHCVGTSNPWPVALAEEEFDWLVLQPFEGTTMDEDEFVITEFASMQPNADIVLHSGWWHAGTFIELYEGGLQETMTPSPEYMDSLRQRIVEAFPNRRVRFTRANDLLNTINDDVENGSGPFEEFSDIFRDFIHVDLPRGRYLMHQALRWSTDQELFNREDYPDTTNEEFDYLENVLHRTVAGDCNKDGYANLLDITDFVDDLSSNTYDLSSDANFDGTVNLNDIAQFVDLLLSQ